MDKTKRMQEIERSLARSADTRVGIDKCFGKLNMALDQVRRAANDDGSRYATIQAAYGMLADCLTNAANNLRAVESEASNYIKELENSNV
ncbi:MAG: hypothetical protein IJR58_06120 [Lachnospiraceae bacterium]|nr:hypothetical protein [Lachnospiraceae bacterium]